MRREACCAIVYRCASHWLSLPVSLLHEPSFWQAGVSVDDPRVHGNPTDRATTSSAGHPLSSPLDAAEILAQQRSRCSPLNVERHVTSVDGRK